MQEKDYRPEVGKSERMHHVHVSLPIRRLYTPVFQLFSFFGKSEKLFNLQKYFSRHMKNRQEIH